jgi:hypothetical protein
LIDAARQSGGVAGVNHGFVGLVWSGVIRWLSLSLFEILARLGLGMRLSST